MNKNLDDAINKFMDDTDCNIKEKQVIQCFNELDQVSFKFLKKRKYKKCLTLDQEFKNCLVYSNSHKLTPKVNYDVGNVFIDRYLNYKEWKFENQTDALNFMTGKISEQDLLNKETNKKVTKKIVEF